MLDERHHGTREGMTGGEARKSQQPQHQLIGVKLVHPPQCIKDGCASARQNKLEI